MYYLTYDKGKWGQEQGHLLDVPPFKELFDKAQPSGPDFDDMTQAAGFETFLCDEVDGFRGLAPSLKIYRNRKEKLFFACFHDGIEDDDIYICLPDELSVFLLKKELAPLLVSLLFQRFVEKT